MRDIETQRREQQDRFEKAWRGGGSSLVVVLDGVSSIVGSEVPKTECACDKMFKLLDRGGCGFLLLHCGPKTRLEGDIVQRRRSGGGSKQGGEDGEGEGIEKEDVRPTRSWRSSSSHPRTRRIQWRARAPS